MPPQQEPRTPPGKAAKGLGGKLSKRIGPFPVWLWLAAAVGVLAIVFIYLRSRGGGGDAAVPGDTGGFFGSGYSPVDAAGAGAPAENAAPAQSISPDTFDQMFQSGLERFGVTAYQGELRGQIKDIEDALEAQGWSFEDQQITPPGNGAPPVGETVLDYDPNAAPTWFQNYLDSLGGTQQSKKGTSKPKATSRPKPPAAKPKPKPKPKPKQKPKPAAKPQPKRKPQPSKPAAKPKPKKAPARQPARRGAGRAGVRAQ